MDRRVIIPVKVQKLATYQQPAPSPESGTLSPDHDQRTYDNMREQNEHVEEVQSAGTPVPERSTEWTGTAAELDVSAEVEEWHDRALRLQADMENYRKRQHRLAQDEIEAERQRLLRAFLAVVDDLERALEAPPDDGMALQQGIQLTHQVALQLLKKEGAEPIQAEHQPFDPAWHEAVGVLDRDRIHLAPNTVVRVLAPGYRLGDRLLRPAKVIVSV
jgi:molecular chaperone GrpE